MTPWSRRAPVRGSGPGGAQRGSATVDFTFLAVLLVIPVVYLVVTVARLQAASYAVAQASREAGRALVTTPPAGDPLARAQTAGALAFEDQGFTGAESGTVTVECAARPCLQPDATISVTATVPVRLPLLPQLLAGAGRGTMTVSATHRVTVDRFRSVP